MKLHHLENCQWCKSISMHISIESLVGLIKSTGHFFLQVAHVVLSCCFVNFSLKIIYSHAIYVEAGKRKVTNFIYKLNDNDH